MILGIDFGLSTTDFALLKGKKIVRTFSMGKIPVREVGKHLKKLNLQLGSIELIAVTGGHSKKLSGKKVNGISVKHVPELKAIGSGGAFVSGKRKCLVVSMGTGTCIVFHCNGKSRHLGGTGVGGGTLIGLSKLLLGTGDIDKIQKLASRGSAEKVDLSVREAIGSGIGLVPGSATASNFAKLSSRNKTDLAAATVRLVSEAVAVAACLAARSAKVKEIVFVGKTPSIPCVRKELCRVARYYSTELFFPKNAGSATAIGAALMHENS